MKRFIRLKSILTPFTIINHKDFIDDGYIGYSSIYLFCFRIALIQRTKPWKENE